MGRLQGGRRFWKGRKLLQADIEQDETYIIVLTETKLKSAILLELLFGAVGCELLLGDAVYAQFRHGQVSSRCNDKKFLLRLSDVLCSV